MSAFTIILNRKNKGGITYEKEKVGYNVEVCDQCILTILDNDFGAWRAGITGTEWYACGDAMGCRNMQLVSDDCTPCYVEKAQTWYEGKGVLSKRF